MVGGGLTFGQEDRRKVAEGWRDASVTESTSSSSRGPGFESQNVYDTLQLPVPEDLMPSPDCPGHLAYTWYTHMHKGKTSIHIINTILIFLKRKIKKGG